MSVKSLNGWVVMQQVPHKFLLFDSGKLCLTLSPQPAFRGLLHCSCLVLNPSSFHSNIKVTLGAHNIKKRENTQVISVVKAKPHENFNSDSLVNDIMLLKVPFCQSLVYSHRSLAYQSHFLFLVADLLVLRQ